MSFCNLIDKLLHKMTKVVKKIAFRKLNTTLLTTHLAVPETLTRATSRALHKWNIGFKEP